MTATNQDQTTNDLAQPRADAGGSEIGHSDRFVFEALVRYDGTDWDAVVRYDGDGATLKQAAQQTGVSVEPTDPPAGADDAVDTHYVRVSGNGVRSALQQYAERATSHQAYVLGDVDVLNW